MWWNYFCGVVIGALALVFSGGSIEMTVEPYYVFSVNDEAPSATNEEGKATIDASSDLVVNFN